MKVFGPVVFIMNTKIPSSSRLSPGNPRHLKSLRACHLNNNSATPALIQTVLIHHDLHDISCNGMTSSLTYVFTQPSSKVSSSFAFCQKPLPPRNRTHVRESHITMVLPLKSPKVIYIPTPNQSTSSQSATPEHQPTNQHPSN
jgi:hypothetical protein